MQYIISFFSDKPGYFHFELFGWIHFLITLCLVLGVVYICNKQNDLSKLNINSKMPNLMASILFINMTIFYFDQVLRGTWKLIYSLPLHFCFISGYLFMFCLVFNKRNWFRFVYYFSFIGPLPAIIFPDLVCSFDRYIFWHFIISHHLFVLFSVYTNQVLGWEVDYKDIKKTMVVANIIFIAVFIFNLIFKTNYIMTDELPAHVIKLLPFISQFNIPILWLELAGFSAGLVAWIPLYYKNKRKIIA